MATHLGERNAPGGRTFGIVLDGVSLLRHPLDGLASGAFADHGIVTGWARDEARMWYAFGMMPEVETREALLVSLARFHPNDAPAQLAALEAEVPGKSLTEYEEIFLSRAIYRDPALQTLRQHKGASGTGYGYQFSWVPHYEGGRLGAAHDFDEPFVFGDVSPERVPLAAGDPLAPVLAARMNGTLYAFARSGDPGWATYEGERSIMHFGD